MVNLPRLRVDLIDRDVNVFVLLVAVAYRDVLMFTKSGRVDGAPNHHLELPFAERTVIGVKRDHQVVGPVTFDAVVRPLKRLHHMRSRRPHPLADPSPQGFLPRTMCTARCLCPGAYRSRTRERGRFGDIPPPFFHFFGLIIIAAGPSDRSRRECARSFFSISASVRRIVRFIAMLSQRPLE